MVKLVFGAIEISAIKKKVKDCLAVHVACSVALLMAQLSTCPQKIPLGQTLIHNSPKLC
jgi:hypothetical protein